MRDYIKSEEYFRERLQTLTRLFQKVNEEIKQGNVKSERILPVKMHMINMLLDKIQVKYSLAVPVNDLYEDYYHCIDLVNKYWPDSNKKLMKYRKPLNQYVLGYYDVMLWLLSIGYLLRVPNNKFMLLVSVLEKDAIKDELFETIICAKVPNREKVFEEKQVDFPVFKNLQKALNTQEKDEALKLMTKYVKSDWYKGHKGSGWYNSHKSKVDSYSGYWCFEAAAISCILNLDDTPLRESRYYPADLADYYKANKSS